MTNPIVLVILGELFVFGLGVLVGNGYNTREQDQRDRRQAARQRQLNDQARALGE